MNTSPVPRRSSLLLHILFVLLWFSPLAHAQVQTAVTPAPEAAAVDDTIPAVPETLRSPRATMASFLHAMNDIKRGKPDRIADALITLDLSEVNVLVRRERGETLAWTLLEVMDKTRLVNLDRVPDREDGKPWIFARYKAGDIRITRQSDGRWQFDRQTLEALPAILEELAGRKRVVGDDKESKAHLPFHLRIREQLPASLKQEIFLLENWHWVALLVLVAIGVVFDWLVSFITRLFIRGWRSRTPWPAFREISDDILRPLGLMAMALVWWIGINLLGLPEQALLVLLVAVKFLASVSGVWAAYRLVDLVAAWLTERARESENKIDDVLAPMIPRTLKIFITVVGVVFVADNLNIDVTGLLAGLGLGGLAFALAAKDMVQNLFGSVTVLLDRTFSVGDWIRVGDQEGTVERMGFRSTRIRTFYNSVLTVPNSTFITANVDNMGERSYRRMKATYGLTYNTPPEKIEAFCEGLRELVRQHPYMRKDYYHIYFNAFGSSSLDILVYVFWETPDWSTELRERHRFLLDSLRLAESLGVEFAYPTQTVYLKQGEGEEAAYDSLTPEEALTEGRAVAQSVFTRTAKAGEKPPPVVFP